MPGFGGWRFAGYSHRSGEVRRALCLPCNTGIGQFRDDPEVVWRALSYVEATFEECELSEVSEEEVRELIRAEEDARSGFYARATRVR
ncbi:endonuclease domain-containing protein [Nonomuraea sp. NPDC005983]|uniref:endonuclease domain-containing protein n=1 Tax=Nonomuraea sp. NPDC005983 TaxID=3155595 RepID=UPI0033ADF7B9